MRIERFFLVVAMMLPTVLAWLYFVAVAPAPEHAGAGNVPMQALYSGGKVFQFALPLLCWALIDRKRLWPAAPSWRGLPLALGFGATAALGIVIVYFTFLKGHSLLAGMPEQVRGKITELGLTSPARYVVFSLFLCLLHSLLEEYYWRGFVFDGLTRWLPLYAAVLVSCLAFTSHHVIVLHVYTSGRFWTGTLPLALGVALGGAVWAWVYHRGGSIYPCWLSHALVDGAIMLVGYDLAFGGPHGA